MQFQTSFYQMQFLNEQILILHTINRAFNVFSKCIQHYQCMQELSNQGQKEKEKNEQKN